MRPSINELCKRCNRWFFDHIPVDDRYKCVWDTTYFKAAKCSKCYRPIVYRTAVVKHRINGSLLHADCWYSLLSKPEHEYTWDVLDIDE